MNETITNCFNKIKCFVIGIIIVLLTTQVGVVDCRMLPSTSQLMTGTSTVDTMITRLAGREQVQLGKLMGKSEVRWRVKELAHKLASGPSKRGPGH